MSEPEEDVGALRAALLREKELTKRLSRRIHEQRCNLRRNWEIVETRALGRLPVPEQIRSRILASWSDALDRMRAAILEVERLTAALRAERRRRALARSTLDAIAEAARAGDHARVVALVETCRENLDRIEDTLVTSEDP